MKGDWEGIPGEWIDDPTAIDGRRFLVSKSAISEMRERMCKVAKNSCEYCANRCYDGHRHHVFGRGMGSGKREDRPIVCGVRFVLWICRSCHEQQKIVKPWGSWSLIPATFSGLSPARGRVLEE